MKDFSIVLSSNASKEIYGDINEASHFYNVLPYDLNFPKDEEWSVALKEITYAANIPSITNEYMTIKRLNTAKGEIVSIPIHHWNFKKGRIISGNFGRDKNEMFSFNYEIDLMDIKFDNKMIIDTDRFKYYGSIEGWPFHALVDLNKISVEIKRGDGYYNLRFKSVGRLLPKHPDNHLGNLKISAPSDLRLFLSLYAVPYAVFEKKILTSGYYDSVEKLVDELNIHVSPLNCKFRVDEDGAENKRITVKLDKNVLEIKLENSLEYILGFRDAILTKDYKTAEYASQLQRGIFALFIYCNIVESNIVGDTCVKLLRTLHINKRHQSEIINQIIWNPTYVSLDRKCIREVEIQICDSFGELVPFKNTKILMTLEFKRI